MGGGRMQQERSGLGFDERKNVMVSWNQTGACSGDECRSRLVWFIRSKNVRVWDIRLIEPAYWWIYWQNLYGSPRIAQELCAFCQPMEPYRRCHLDSRKHLVEV